MIETLLLRSSALAARLLIGAVVVIGTVGVASAQAGPCDIYGSAGTACVAAHSTTRALFAAYDGRLYQVRRASDGATTDIETLAVGGFANAAAQDAFCAGTSCIITIIYDQSSRGNHLSISPAGGAGGADVGANAAALPAIAGGHKVYGVHVTPGVGYRNLAATGTARNGQAEGMYMVTGAKNTNAGCCFDYGNTEQPLANDTGNGHMDAVYFGFRCEHPPCSGAGPWIAADLENGLFQGNGSNLADQSITFDVVTAMLKNNGQTAFVLKTGNSQAGGLTTQYNGTLPTSPFTGYAPMHQEGGIVMGVGGDNSNASAGDFFEGVMTFGFPTDAADNAVQANIASVAYAVPTFMQVVPTSEAAGQSWRFTTATPPSSWNTTGFNDGGWNTGNGGFGTAGTPGAVIRTTWNTADIWQRRTFNPGGLTAAQRSNLVLRLHHDEAAEIFINGVLAASVSGFTTSYAFTPVSAAARNAVIANGNNVLAVHCHQTTGGQYIDTGLFTVEPPSGGNDLVASYAFENNASDGSGNGFNGTVVNNPTFVAGHSGLAVNLNGTNQSVQLPRTIQDSFTISFWVRTTTTGATGAQWWVGRGLVDGEVANVANDFGVSLVGSRVAFGVGNPDTTIQSTSNVNDGAWHHVVVTRNAATGAMVLYFDGAAQAAATGPTGTRSAPVTLRVGSLQTNLNFFAGQIDEVRLYSAALTAAQVAAIP
jgi:alpha-L-arabinofuranosidase B-like protein/concanavalin A-like lectin/glucanase superfamily protein